MEDLLFSGYTIPDTESTFPVGLENVGGHGTDIAKLHYMF
jgi:hypothetical protein